MPSRFTAALAEALSKKSQVAVVEGRDGEEIKPGTVYIAPGGRQMRIERTARIVLRITDDPAENNCRPSADYLFRSVAEVYRAAALGIIMTGMGSDGVRGLRVMKLQGAKIVAQDEASCTVFGMPREA